MTSLNPNETSRSWRHYGRSPAVQLFVSDADGRAGALVGERAAGFPLSVSPCDPAADIDPSSLIGFAAAIVEVAVDDPSSVKRFEKLAKKSRTPLIAAAYEAPLALVRQLIRSGAHDVLPLPIELAEIEASLAPLRDRLAQHSVDTTVRGKVVAVIKSSGGAGATSLLGQLAIKHAEQEAAFDRKACIIDLDVQFGDAAFQLGLHPKLSLMDLVEAGSRLDAEMLRATSTEHPSGLQVIAAPRDVIPLESLSNDQVLDIVELAAGEFGTVFLDLPSNWANWSLSVLARADLVLLVTEISVPTLRQARRQLDLIRSQDLGDLQIRVIANRWGAPQSKNIRTADIRAALGCDIAYTVVDEDAVMQPAIDRGIPISEVKRKSAIGRDIEQLEKGVAVVLGLER